MQVSDAMVCCVTLVWSLHFFLHMLSTQISVQLQLSGTGLRDCQEWIVSTDFFFISGILMMI